MNQSKCKPLKKPSSQAVSTVYRRKLIKAWQFTEQSLNDPDPMIKNLFKLAIQDSTQRKYKAKAMVFTHSLHRRGFDHKQRYRITGLDQLVLIPPNGTGLNELTTCIFKV